MFGSSTNSDAVRIGCAAQGVPRHQHHPDRRGDRQHGQQRHTLPGQVQGRIVNSLRVEVFEARQLNQYRLKDPIGAGDMGVVYLAEHQLLKRPWAVKLIAPDRAGNPKALARLEHEVRTTARLSHPNTVEIYDYGRTDDGTFYYVMELLSGLSLSDLVEATAPCPPAGPSSCSDRCAARWSSARRGLVHRDLKPANIFAARRGNLHDFVKLLDFGLVMPAPGPSTAEAQPGKPHRRFAVVHGTGAGHERRPVSTPAPPLRLGCRCLLPPDRPAPFAGPTAMAVMVALARPRRAAVPASARSPE